MNKLVDKVVIPGDVIGQVESGMTIRLGPGLIQMEESIIATKAGILRFKSPDRFWIENNQKRYIPAVDDLVIGIITERHAEDWKVDIACHQPATLSMYNFENVTRRNRPNLNVGDLVYARVIVANKDMEPEISCVSTKGKADGFGALNGGYMFKASTRLVRKCLEVNSYILQALGKHFPYEVAAGMNGRIWVNSNTIENTVLITNAILNSELLNQAQIDLMVQKLAQRAKKKGTNL